MEGFQPKKRMRAPNAHPAVKAKRQNTTVIESDWLLDDTPLPVGGSKPICCIIRKCAFHQREDAKADEEVASILMRCPETLDA